MDEYGGYSLLGPRRRRLLLTLVGIVALVALALFAVRQEGERRLDDVARRAERRLGPTELAAHVRPPVPRVQNAAVALEEAAALLAEVAEDRHVLRQVGGRAPATWSNADTARLRDLVARHEAARALLAAAAERPRSSFGWESSNDGFAALLDLLSLARLPAAELRLAAADGDAGRAAAALRQLTRFSEALYAEGSLVGGSAVERIELAALRDAFAAGLVPPPSAADLLPRSDPRRVLRAAMAREVAEDLAAARAPGGPLRWLTADADSHRLWTWTFRLAGRWLIADYQRPRLAAAAGETEPYRRAAARVEAASPRWLPHSPLPPPWSAERGLLTARATLAARQLATAALQLGAREGLPSLGAATSTAFPADPLLGEPLVVEGRPDGTLHLAYPAAARLLREREMEMDELLEWEIPALLVP